LEKFYKAMMKFFLSCLWGVSAGKTISARLKDPPNVVKGKAARRFPPIVSRLSEKSL
jgi:hypothetical protein